MPIYVYEVLDEDGIPGFQFEVHQRMTDDALTKHPTTGEPCRRVIQAPYIAGEYSHRAMMKDVNNDKKIDSLGMTKYVKAGDGFYEKRAGKGPDVISAND